MEKNKKEEHSENSTLKWFIQVFTMTFILSIIFSYVSTNGVSNLSLIPACLILILVIAKILEVFLNIQTCFTSLFCKYGFITQIIYTWPKYKYHKKSIPSHSLETSYSMYFVSWHSP